jgi:hypothetical protein
MTIGANLNGGSLTIGAAGATTNVSGRIVNIANSLPANGYIKIADLINGTGSYIVLGSETLGENYIRGKCLYINDTGLSATGVVNIGNGTNAVGSQVNIGSSTLSGLYLRGKDVLINYQQGTPQAPVYTYIGNDTAGSTNIVGQTNIANTGLSTNDGVNIATNGYGTSSYVTIGSANFPQIYMRSFNTRINDDGGNCYLGKDNSGRVELRGSIVVLNGQGGDLNLGGVSSGTINLYRPLTPIYPISFTSGQIGYSSSSQAGGSLVNSTYNNLLMGTLTGVYMISCRSYVAAGSFTGVTTYDFQMGLNGVGELTRCYLGGSNLNYSNNQQTLSMLYSSSGPTNPGSALLYANVFITWTSSTGGPIWGITIFYTRVA